MWISVALKGLSGGILLLESLLDVKQKKVHVSGAVVIAVCGIITLFIGEPFVMYSFIASVSIGLFLWVLSVLTEEKIGRGDAMYMVALGILLGFQKTMMMSMLSFLAAAFVGVVLLICKKATKETKISFFPFLLFGYVLVICGDFYQGIHGMIV